MTMRELKPCPFCGEKVSAYSMHACDGLITELDIHCPTCNTHFNIQPKFLIYSTRTGTMREYEKGDAVEIWNRRADND